MINFIFGNTGAGKTTLAKDMLKGFCKGWVWLDGDNMRGVWTDLGLSKEDRYEQNLRVARLAKMLEEQGFNVLVSLICPYRDLRDKVRKITNCKFIYMEGGKVGKEYPFEKP